jgi:phospholipid transport system substrate-binding protein
MVRRSDAGLVLVVAGALVLFTPRTAPAGPPTDQLKDRVDQILKVVQDPELKKESRAAERRAAIRRIASEIFDFEDTSKRALGRYWQERTPEERKEFVQLFTDLLEHSYVSKIEQYHGEKISYVGETLDGDVATVRTRIVTQKGTEVPIDYRMQRQGDRWRVYDVVIEGVSLVSNYRTQFNKIIQTSSYKDLVEKLRAKAFAAPETPGKS